MSLLSTQNLLWLAIFWATFAKNGLLFVPTSVHTASPPFTELPTFLVLARSWKQHTTTKRLPPLIWNSNFCRATRKLKLAVTIFQYPKFFFSPKLSSKYWQQHCCRLKKGDVELEFFSLNIWPLWSCCKTFECVNVYEKKFGETSFSFIGLLFLAEHLIEPESVVDVEMQSAPVQVWPDSEKFHQFGQNLEHLWQSFDGSLSNQLKYFTRNLGNIMAIGQMFKMTK